MEERNALVRAIFARAAVKVGSRARLAAQLGVGYDEVGRYMAGEAIPPEAALLGAAVLLGDELRRIRINYSESAWRSLKLPR